jgi:hypothetical protein
MKKTCIALSLTLASIITLTSCEKDPSEIGVNLQPGSDKIVIASDSLAVETHTVRDSSLASDERSYSLLGSIYEDDFGITGASFVTQVRLSSSNVQEDVTINADSLVIELDYSRFYGDSSSNIAFDLYQLKNSDLYIDSTYYSDYNPGSDPDNLNLLGSYDITPAPDDSIMQISITDTSLLGLFNDKDIYVSNENFLNAFKGLYFKTQTQTSVGGCIAYLNLLSENSRMVMHYNDSLTYDFLINSSAVRINLFDHDYSLASPDLINALDDNTNEDVSFVHSAAGLRTEIRVLDTAKLRELQEAGISRAQLQVKIHPDFNHNYGKPSIMTLVYENNSGLYEFLTDYKVSTSHFGGELNSAGDEYVFNIPLFVQDLINNDGTVELDNYLSLFALDNRTSANHCAIYGGNNDSQPLQILIVTSEY